MAMQSSVRVSSVLLLRASGTVNLISDSYEQPPASIKGQSASFSCAPSTNGALLRLQQAAAARAQRQQLPAQPEDAAEAEHPSNSGGGGGGGGDACVAAGGGGGGGGGGAGVIAATAAAGSLLSLVVLGVAAGHQRREPGWLGEGRGGGAGWEQGAVAPGTTLHGDALAWVGKGGHAKHWWQDTDDILRVS